VTILAVRGVRDEQAANICLPATVFCDTAESEFYARSVKDFLLQDLGPLRGWPIVELGTGTGEAIARVLQETSFPGEVHGYEIQTAACEYAREVTKRYGVPQYQVFNRDFFTAVLDYPASSVISNPPYLPAPDAEIDMPELWGGPDGSDVVRRLLGSGFAQLVTTLSSFSNPLATINYATRHGYRIADFAIRSMRFGRYSSEPKVRAHIEKLGNEKPRKAFVTENGYCLATVLWTREAEVDLSRVLKRLAQSRDTHGRALAAQWAAWGLPPSPESASFCKSSHHEPSPQADRTAG
jgi:SAM-dependent methyltransferase